MPCSICKTEGHNKSSCKRRTAHLIDSSQDLHYALQRQDSRDINALSSMLKLSQEMMGIDMRKYDKALNFQNIEPVIELYEIIQFIKKVSESRDTRYNSAIYINMCMNSKWYVGISYTTDSSPEKYENAVKKRLASHRNNGGCNGAPTNWTWIHPVISTVAYTQGNLTDENLLTQLIAKCVGEDNVRGGIWTSFTGKPTLPEMTVDQIKDAILNNRP